MSSDSNCLLILPASTDEGVYVYDINSLHTLPSFCPYPKTYNSHGMSIIATCEDCLLAAEWSFLILLNPSTRTYRQIPSEPILGYYKHVRYGMWHHVNEFNDEYKVFRIAIDADMLGSKTEVMVYNTTTNTWKEVESKIGVDTFESYCTPSVVQNHLLHLLFFNLDHGCTGDLIKRIGCFDMKAEQWANDVQLPDVLWDKNGIDFCLHKPYDLGKLKDQLCFMGCNAIESTFDWWVMKEYGVKESWVKLMSLPVPCDRNGELLWGVRCRPLAYRPGSPHELLFFIIGGPHNCILCWYNLIDNEAFEAEFSLPLEDASHCQLVLRNVDTLGLVNWARSLSLGFGQTRFMILTDGYNWYSIAYIAREAYSIFPVHDRLEYHCGTKKTARRKITNDAEFVHF